MSPVCEFNKVAFTEALRAIVSTINDNAIPEPDIDSDENIDWNKFSLWQLRPRYDEETTPDASAHEYTKMSSLGSLKFLF